jgi:hypothetical protein
MERILFAHSDCSASLKASPSGMICIYDTQTPDSGFRRGESAASAVVRMTTACASACGIMKSSLQLSVSVGRTEDLLKTDNRRLTTVFHS